MGEILRYGQNDRSGNDRVGEEERQLKESGLLAESTVIAMKISHSHTLTWPKGHREFPRKREFTHSCNLNDRKGHGPLDSRIHVNYEQGDAKCDDPDSGAGPLNPRQ